jgi:hypothetical protein
VLTVGLCVAALGTAWGDNGSEEEFSPASVRRATQAAGLDRLARVAVPLPSNLFHFVRNTKDGMVATANSARRSSGTCGSDRTARRVPPATS